MLPDKDSFYKKFPMYTDGNLQLVHGRTTRDVKSDAKLIAYTSPEAFFQFFGGLVEGMTLDECWVEWCEAASSKALDRWEDWLKWDPSPKEWWVQPFTGQRLHIRNGVVETTTVDDPRMRVPNSRSFYKQFKDVVPGMKLAEVQQLVADGSSHGKACRSIYFFEPRVRRINCPVTNTQKERGQILGGLPPYLSTNKGDVRIFRVNNAADGRIDLVQVCLYALTKIWADSARTCVDKHVKERARDYFQYAHECIRLDPFFREHPEYLQRLKPGKMRVTRDCCVEVDFNVV